MDRNDKNKIENFTPCRISECFKDEDGIIEVTNITGVFRLKDVGRMVWIMLDGKHTVTDIVNTICLKTDIKDRDIVKSKVIALLNNLRNRKAIIANWDSIYKFDISQELTNG